MELKQRKITLILVFAFFAAGMTGIGTSDSAAQSYPAKEITYALGYAPGGVTYGACVITSEFLAKELKTKIIVEPIPGAANLVGLNSVYSRKGDGYTIFHQNGSDGPFAHYYLGKTVPPWTPDKWRSVGVYSIRPGMGIIVKKDSPWKDFVEFIEDCRKRPGKINYASLGPGRFEDFFVMEMQEKLGVEFNWIFYDSSASVQADILTGDLHAGQIGVVRDDFIDHPNFRVLTVLTDKFPDDPDWYYPFPNLSDFQKQLNYNIDNWRAVKVNTRHGPMVRADVPDERVAILEKALKAVAENPEWKKRIKAYLWPGWASAKECDKYNKEVFESILKEFKPKYEQYFKKKGLKK